MQKSIIADQWRWKIVEFRGAEARRHAALSCFSPANIELFIATNSPDDSLLLSWLHSCRFTSIFGIYIYIYIYNIFCKCMDTYNSNLC